LLILRSEALVEVVPAAYAAFRGLVEQDAVTFGPAETALGAAGPDRKRYLELSGMGGPPLPASLTGLRDCLCAMVTHSLDQIGTVVLPSGRALQSMIDRRAGPVLRLSWYPPGPVGPVNHEHTDIDLFTLLPAATGPGLQVLGDGRWQQVDPGADGAVVLAGALAQEFGGVPAACHRVVGDGRERISASLFVNARLDLLTDGGELVSDLFSRRLHEVQAPAGPGGWEHAR
jgi:hypothetical protein